MAVILKGVRSLIQTVSPSDNPKVGQRALLARASGWFDRTSDGVETPLRQMFIQPTMPTPEQTEGMDTWTWVDTSTDPATWWVEDGT